MTLGIAEAPITLGCDPGLENPGLVVLGPDGRVMFQECHHIPQSGEGHGRRLSRLYERVCFVIRQWQVSLVGVEIADAIRWTRGEIATGRTTYWLGAGAGVCVVAAHRLGVEVREWRVQNIRKAFCANPYAKKAQVIEVCRQRGFTIPCRADGEPEDAISDALAVAQVVQEEWKLDQLVEQSKPARRRRSRA